LAGTAFLVVGAVDLGALFLADGAAFLGAGDFFGADGAAFFAAVTMISFNVCAASGPRSSAAEVQEHARHRTGG
jgi:hypothetical protein